jgi:hypothetical protein
MGNQGKGEIKAGDGTIIRRIIAQRTRGNSPAPIQVQKAVFPVPEQNITGLFAAEINGSVV